MTLAAHFIAGAALAESVAPQAPFLAFIAGFASHFILDALPHWDYQLTSRRENPVDPLDETMIFGRAFFFDLLKISFDLLLGIVVLTLFLSARGVVWNWSSVLGALGGVLPDFFQFVYFKLRLPFLKELHRFHHRCHTKIKLINQPLLGLFSQIALILFLLWLAF